MISSIFWQSFKIIFLLPHAIKEQRKADTSMSWRSVNIRGNCTGSFLINSGVLNLSTRVSSLNFIFSICWELKTHGRHATTGEIKNKLINSWNYYIELYHFLIFPVLQPIVNTSFLSIVYKTLFLSSRKTDMQQRMQSGRECRKQQLMQGLSFISGDVSLQMIMRSPIFIFLPGFTFWSFAISFLSIFWFSI